MAGGRVKPADLKQGTQIRSGIGPLTVLAEPFVDLDPDTPQFDRVYVDVEPDDKSSRWDPDDLPKATGAEDFQFLGLSPLRYRLAFLPDTEVAAVTE